jgi:hypothetical protein
VRERRPFASFNQLVNYENAGEQTDWVRLGGLG